MINREHTADRRNRRLVTALAACTFFVAVQTSRAQETAASLPLFQEVAPLEMTLEAPLRALRRNSRTRPEHAGVIRLPDAGGSEIALDIEVRVRGNSRLAECDFPPLRLDFRRGQLEDTIFAGQNRLKLVTLCKSRDSYRDYLYLEHDIYRLFNALSDQSFRVRRVDVQYVSTDSRREEIFTEPAFLIEEDWEVAQRHGTDVIEQEQIALTSLNRQHTALFSIFQFMIGNTDWSALSGPAEEPCCHNGKVIGAADVAPILLPYDFDQAGLIYTDYSSPNERLGIRTVRQRLYRGYCELNPEIDQAVAQIVGQRDALESVVLASEAGERAKSDALEYLRESLDLLSDRNTLVSHLQEKCR